MRRPLVLLVTLTALVLLPHGATAQGGCNGGMGNGSNGSGGPPPPPPPPPGGGTTGGGGPSGPGASRPSAPSSGGGGYDGPVSGRPSRSPRTGPSRPSAPTARPDTAPAAPSSPRRRRVPADDSVWSTWWELNQHGYLALRTHLAGTAAATGSDAFDLGPGETRAEHPLRSRPDPATIEQRVAPALTALLDSSSNPELLSACLIGLGRLGPLPTTSERLSSFLSHPSRQVREAALVGLGLSADAHSAFLLADLADGQPPARALSGSARVDARTRAFAAYSLALLCDRTRREDLRRYCVGRLVRTLESQPDREVAVACFTALGLAPLSDGPVPERAGASASLRAQVRWLLSALEDLDDAVVRSHAVTALGRLAAGLADGSPERDAVLRRLRQLAGPRSRQPAVVEQAAVLSLGAVADGDLDKPDRDARELLAECARRTGNADLRHLALVALAEACTRPGSDRSFDPAPTRALLSKELSRGKSSTRPWAALALGLVERGSLDAGQPASRDVQLALRHALAGARSPSEIGAAAIALGLSHDSGALDSLLDRLGSASDEESRRHLALAVGMLGDPRGLESLRALAENSLSRPALLREASRAAGLLGDRALVERLDASLVSSATLASQSACALALAEVGDARSVEALLEILSDPARTSAARAFAADALGRVCDPSDLPAEAPLLRGLNYHAAATCLTSAEGSGVADLL